MSIPTSVGLIFNECDRAGKPLLEAGFGMWSMFKCMSQHVP